MRKSFGLLAICTFTALICACTPDAQEPANSASTTEQPLLPDSVRYGEGINLLGDDGTGNICMSAMTNRTLPTVVTTPGTPVYEEENQYNQPFHRAFWVHSKRQYKRRLLQSTAIEDGKVFDFEDFERVAERHYDQVFDGYDGPVLTIISVIPTADITVDKTTIECRQGETTLEAWIADCGVRYMGERKLGHYFFLSAKVPDLTPILNEQTKWTDFYQILDVESYTNHNTDDAINLIARTYPGIQFYYSHRHGDGKILLEDWLDLRDVYQAPENSDGVTIWERTPVYDANGPLEETCIGDEITGAFNCYYQFEYWSQRARKSAQNKLTVVENAYSNPQEYEPITDAERKNYQSVLSDFGQLLDGNNPFIDGLTQDCVDSLSTANENTICKACGGAANEIQDLVNRLDQISDPELLPPVGQTYGIPTQPNINIEELELDKTSPATHRDFYDSICMLSRIGGDFAGGGERVHIAANKSSNGWLMEVASQRNNTSQRVTGTFTCSDGFVRDTCGGIYCKHYEECDTNTNSCVLDPDFFNTLQNFETSGNTNTSVAPGVPYPKKPYLAPLAGLGGKMNGLGEGAWTEQAVSPARLRSNSQVGGIRGYSTGMRLFGSSVHQFPVIDPASLNNPQEYQIDIKNGTYARIEDTLLSASEGFCYLVEVKGDFDGAGENVGVENVNGTWVLRARAGRYDNCGIFSANNCEPKPVRVTARCVRY